MKRFIQRFADKIIGVLSGFDRLIIRGTLRPISYAQGMKRFLWHRQVLLKDFGPYVEGVTKELRAAGCRLAEAEKRPIIYLRSGKTDKLALAHDIAAQDHITSGLIAVLSCVETCMSYKVCSDRPSRKIDLEMQQRKCIYLYHYFIDPQFGFMSARIQAWFPFQIQICLNGREWLARQMDQAALRYQRLDNCFPWIEDFEKAQQLMARQLRICWPKTLDRFAAMLNPIHEKIFEGFPIRYYWSVYENEWATDLAFESSTALAAVYPSLVLHAMSTFSSRDVLRFLGRKLHGNFTNEVVTDFKDRSEGVRIKHRVGKNSIKLYDKFGRVLRVEFTMNDPHDFKAFRPQENDPAGPSKWRPLRRGIADLHRRAKVSQAANERYLEALSAADTATPLGELLRDICLPTTYNGKRVRALRPWSQEDVDLFRAVSHGEFCINGFRNRDLQGLLFKGSATCPTEKRRRSSRVTRLLRLLRAHHLIQKVHSTYRYVLTPKGNQIIAAILAAQRISVDQLNRLAA